MSKIKVSVSEKMKELFQEQRIEPTSKLSYDSSVLLFEVNAGRMVPRGKQKNTIEENTLG